MVCVFGDPCLLRGESEADEQKIGGGLTDGVQQALVFFAVLGFVKIAVMCTADPQRGVALAKLDCRLLGNGGCGAQKKERKSVTGGKGKQPFCRIDSRQTRLEGRAAKPRRQRDSHTVGEQEIGRAE